MIRQQTTTASSATHLYSMKPLYTTRGFMPSRRRFGQTETGGAVVLAQPLSGDHPRLENIGPLEVRFDLSTSAMSLLIVFAKRDELLVCRFEKASALNAATRATRAAVTTDGLPDGGEIAIQVSMVASSTMSATHLLSMSHSFRT